MALLRIAILTLLVALSVRASEVQRQIDEAAPGSTLTVEPGAYVGPLLIDKPLKLVGRNFPRIDGGGEGNVISIRADDVTVQGLLIVNSGVNLTKDNAGVHVTANRATISGT